MRECIFPLSPTLHCGHHFHFATRLQNELIMVHVLESLCNAMEILYKCVDGDTRFPLCWTFIPFVLANVMMGRKELSKKLILTNLELTLLAIDEIVDAG